MIAAASAAGTTTNWLDPVIIGIIALSAFLGVWRGLIRSVAGLAGLILAALFAGKLAAYADPALKHAGIKNAPVTGGWTFVVAFIAIVVAVEIGANILVWVGRLMLLGWVDRLGGLVFGAARGVLLSMILLAGFAQLGSKDFNTAIKQGTVAVWLWKNVPSVTNMLPAGMRDSTIRLVHDKAPFLDQVLPTPTATPKP